MDQLETGSVEAEKIAGKSTVTRCFSKYPLKFIIPKKVGPASTNAVWIYTLTYGGGIVSGDSISCNFTIGDDCTAVLTTQASTKVYKSVGIKCSEQMLEARVGSNALFVVTPDPVTCFSTARYSQKQVFRVLSDSNLVVVDWFTSGRYESGEKWDFGLYKSSNNIFLEDHQPLFLDTVISLDGSLQDLVCRSHLNKDFQQNTVNEDVFLEKGNASTIAERMQDYNVIAMVILLGPKLRHLQLQVQENVKKMMSGHLHITSSTLSGRKNSGHCLSKPKFIASCSVFGPKGVGLVTRIAATTTESVYKFLRLELSGLETLLGVSPYR